MLCKTGNYVLGLDLRGERVISIKMMINFKKIIKFIVHLQVLHPQLVTADCAFQAPTSPSPPELQVSNNYKQLKVIRQYPSKTGPLSYKILFVVRGDDWADQMQRLLLILISSLQIYTVQRELKLYSLSFLVCQTEIVTWSTKCAACL